MLKTLWSGNECGMAKMSPRNATCASGTTAELTKLSPEPDDRPAAASALGLAGMTPPFASSASTLLAAPTATSHMPGTETFASRYHAPSR